MAKVIAIMYDLVENPAAQVVVRMVTKPEGAETFTEDVEDLYLDVDFSMTEAQLNDSILDGIKDYASTTYSVTLANSDIRYQPFVIPS